MEKHAYSVFSTLVYNAYVYIYKCINVCFTITDGESFPLCLFVFPGFGVQINGGKKQSEFDPHEISPKYDLVELLKKNCLEEILVEEVIRMCDVFKYVRFNVL